MDDRFRRNQTASNDCQVESQLIHSIHIEREFFGRDAPKAEFQGRSIRGLTVEQHLKHLREGLLPVAERCGRVMREALGALEALREVPSEVVERSKPFRIAVKL